MYLVLTYELFKVFYVRFDNTFLRRVLNVIAAVLQHELYRVGHEKEARFPFYKCPRY